MRPSEFENFNYLRLEDRTLSFEEARSVEPLIFKKRVQSILDKAFAWSKNRAISNTTRSLLFQILTAGTKAMKIGTNAALLNFYFTEYKDAITQGNQPIFAEAWEWDYIVDNKSTQSATELLDSVDTDIKKLKMDELTNQFNSKSKGLNGFDGFAGGFSELSTTHKVLVVGAFYAAAFMLYKKFYRKA